MFWLVTRIFIWREFSIISLLNGAFPAGSWALPGPCATNYRRMPRRTQRPTCMVICLERLSPMVLSSSSFRK